MDLDFNSHDNAVRGRRVRPFNPEQVGIGIAHEPVDSDESHPRELVLPYPMLPSPPLLWGAESSAQGLSELFLADESVKRLLAQTKEVYQSHLLKGLSSNEAVDAIFDAISPAHDELWEDFCNYDLDSNNMEKAKNEGLSTENARRALAIKAEIDKISPKKPRSWSDLDVGWRSEAEQQTRKIDLPAVVDNFAKKLQESAKETQPKHNSGSNYSTQKKMFDLINENSAGRLYIKSCFDELGDDGCKRKHKAAPPQRRAKRYKFEDS